ncbi:MAG TPA: IPT/TIG domain-containing protein [Bryobacteraceae bacterium]|jgi:uncharacterized protein (TIGR03437 family)
MMLPIAAVFAVLAAGSGNNELQVRGLQQIPAQPQQTITAVTVDSNGNVIATGQNSLGGFISKLDSSGNLVFTLSEVGASGSGVAADANGDVYWIGAADPMDFPFPFTSSVLGSPSAESVPGFVVKFHSADGSIAWATEIGAMNPYSVAIGSDGGVVVAGYADGANASVTPGAYAVSVVAPAVPVEVVKFSPAGTLIFAATYGGSVTAVPAATLPCDLRLVYVTACPHISVNSVLIDPQNHIWIAGSANVSDLPVTSTALNTVCICGNEPYDGYLAELSADGSKLLYGSYVHASSQGGSIGAAAMDADGNIWLAGNSPSNIVANGVPLATTGFLMKYDPSAHQIAKEIHAAVGIVPAYITDIAVGSDGTVAIAGVPAPDSPSQAATAQGYVETFDGSLPGGAAPLVTGVIPLDGNAMGTGLAAEVSGSFVVAGPASIVTELGPSGPVSPVIVSVTGSATPGAATGQISQGQIITIFGHDLGPGIAVTAGVSGKPRAFPTSLAGAQVFAGSVPAPLLYVSESQINAIVPFGITEPSTVTLTVHNNGAVSGPARLGLVAATPGVFTTLDTSQRYPVAAALNQDGTINSSTNPAAPGSIMTIFATGLGAMTTQPADGVLLPETGLPSLVNPVLLGSGAQFLDILYAGPAPDEVAGLMQINFRLPATSAGASPIVMFAGSWISQYFMVWVAGN